MVATRRRKSQTSSRKNKSRHSYFMRGCSRSHSHSGSNSNKHNFFAKGNHGKIHSKKCKCACHLNKHRAPECKCNCHERSKVFELGTKTGTNQGMKGGDALNLSLAYTGKQVPLSPSPYGAYVGKGGTHIPKHSSMSPGNYGATGGTHIPKHSSMSPDTYHGKGGGNSMQTPDSDSTKAYPNVSETGEKMNWLNSIQTIRGGGITGPGTSYANGLVGSSWKGNSETWPGVNGVGGDSNHLTLNTYNNDISRQMLDIGANYPFNGMLSGGGHHHPKGCGCMQCRRKGRGMGLHGPNCNCMQCRRKDRGMGVHGPNCNCMQCRSRRSGRSRGHGRKHKTLRGGGLLPQNLVNVGRNFMYNIGASSNEYNGYASPPNPMPYKDQLVTKSSDILNI
jgi:hypothetical protein